MKISTLMILLPTLLPTFASAQTSSAPIQYPQCSDGLPILPCEEDSRHAESDLIQMMFANQKGFQKIANSAPGKRKHYTDGFMTGEYRVINLARETYPRGSEWRQKSTARYEMFLSDCLGTDHCLGEYLWTADEVTMSDGYTYESTYTNKIEKTNFHSFKEQP